MENSSQVFLDAFYLLATLDPQVLNIVLLSVEVSGTAVIVGSILALPLGASLAVNNFPGRQGLIVLTNTLMGLPSVVVGVVVYLMLSRSGPFGEFGLLYSAPAMICAQLLLVVPLMAAITRQVVEETWKRHKEELHLLRFPWWMSVTTLLYDCRYSLLVALLAGLARAITEVGSVMIVGGNIEGATRVMTTAIALETGKGDLPLAIALGIVLLGVILLLNLLTQGLHAWALQRFG